MTHTAIPQQVLPDQEPDDVWRREAVERMSSVETRDRMALKGLGLERAGVAVRDALDAAGRLVTTLFDELERQAEQQTAPTWAATLALRAAAGEFELAEAAIDVAGRIDAGLPVVAKVGASDAETVAVDIVDGVALTGDPTALARDRRRLERPHVLIVRGAATRASVEAALRMLPKTAGTLVVICDGCADAAAIQADAEREVLFWQAGRAAASREGDAALDRFAAALGAIPADGEQDPELLTRWRANRGKLLAWGAREGPLGAGGVDRIADLLVEAALDGDHASLDEGLRALQERWAAERPLHDAPTEINGGLLALTGFARWAQARVPPLELKRLGSSDFLERLLAKIATTPGIDGKTLADRLGASDSEISRGGRRLLELDLARRTRIGRTARWEATPKGRAGVGYGQASPPAEQVERCAAAARAALKNGSEGDFTVLAVALADACRERNRPAFVTVLEALAGDRPDDAAKSGRLDMFASLARAGSEQIPAVQADGGRPERLAARLLAAVAASPGATSSQLATMLGVTPSSVSRAARPLLDAGRLRREQVGRESRWSVGPQQAVLGSAGELIFDATRLVALGIPQGDRLTQVAVLHLPAALADDALALPLFERAVEVARLARVGVVRSDWLLGILPRILPVATADEDAAPRALVGSLDASFGSTDCLDDAPEVTEPPAALRTARETVAAAVSDARSALKQAA